MSDAINGPSRKAAAVQTGEKAPAWIALTMVAVIGSLAYGASLGLVFPKWNLAGAAVWIALSAGLAWCVFLPALWIATREPLVACIDSCLITMASGELVLVAGAIGNLILAHVPFADPATFNIACVAASNLVMAWVITRRMARLAVPALTTVIVWLVALDGAGAIFFSVFRALLERTP